jgi:6-phosphogluconolactonase
VSTTRLTRPGAVFISTNAAAGNEVLVFPRAADGSLGPAAVFATGGLGNGVNFLGNQGAVILTKRWLVTVNTGSNDITLFAVRPNGLTLRDRVPSGGQQPISLAVHRDLLYVLNAGGEGNITGFRIHRRGRLTQLAQSTRPLSSTNAGAAQVRFNPDGRVLVVTEKATNTITTYTVTDDGLASGPNPQPSAGETPFGFSFNNRGILIVAEAFGDRPGEGAVSSYRVSDTGALQVISASVVDMQTATCWMAVNPNRRFAYSTNTGSATITGFRVGRNGSLTLLDPDGITASTPSGVGDGMGPIDLALTRNGRFLFELNSSGTIGAFRVAKNGSLTPIPGRNDVPAGGTGLAAR